MTHNLLKGLPAARRASMGVIVGIGMMLLAGSAAAATDTVYLKQGGRLRGSVMSDEPSGVSIKLVDGTTRIVEASAVDRVEYGSADADTAPAPAAEHGPIVTLSSDDPAATLDRVLSSAAYGSPVGSIEGGEWRTVCTIPCGKQVERNATYRIRGISHWSREFTLPPGDRLTLKVKNGDFTGVAWAVVGTLAAVTGGALALGGAAGGDHGILVGGLITAGVGIPVGVIGFAIMRDTAVTTDDGRQVAKSQLPVASLRLSGQF